MESIQSLLFEQQDLTYRDFQSKLMPTVDSETVIGVRTPILRKLAKQIFKSEECDAFLAELPHKYFEENQLHTFIVSEIKDMEACLDRVDEFLPYVNNWATSDQLSPKVFKKNKERLLEKIDQWIASDLTYSKRFGIGMLMQHFLNDDFKPEYLDKVIPVRSEEYYVNMMIAWFFATALTKQYESTVYVIEDHLLDDWTHKKAIQKARESLAIPIERKEYLKSLK